MGIVVPTEQVEFLADRGVNAVDLGASYTDIKDMSADVLLTLTNKTVLDNIGTIGAVSAVSTVASLMNDEDFHKATFINKCIMTLKGIAFSGSISALFTSTMVAFSSIEAAVFKNDILGGSFLSPYLFSLGKIFVEFLTIDENSSSLDKLSLAIRGIVLLFAIVKGYALAGVIVNEITKAIFGWFKFRKGVSYV